MTTGLDPSCNPVLLGHVGAERMLRRAADIGRLHHAWLITGAEGVGKATLAYRFARALLAGFPAADLVVERSHPVFTAVAAGTHPDLVTLSLGWDDKKQRARSEIVVEETRRLMELFARTPAAGGWRVVVVDGADDLNRSAENALLKLLEEPPRRAAFVLTSNTPARLAPTIRSRCLRLSLSPLCRVDMERFLRDRAVDAVDGSIIDRAEGSPGRALRLLRTSAIDADDIAETVQRTLYSTQVEAVARARALGTGDISERVIAERGHAWSEVLALAAAARNFNLDRQQLAAELSKAAAL